MRVLLRSGGMSIRGMSIIGGVVAAVITMLAVFCFSKSLISYRKSAIGVRDTQIAEAYAAELLEFFRSHKSDQLKEYLKLNPIGGGLEPYPFCAHVNILDRTADKIVNEDPLAALPTFTGLPGSGNLRANRYYQVQIVNVKTLAVNKARCADTAKSIYLNGRIPVAPNETIALSSEERFLITVGVTWVAQRMNKEDVKRVVLTTLIPEG